MIKTKCKICGLEKEIDERYQKSKIYCMKCNKFNDYLITEKQEGLISFSEGNKELRLLMEEMREITNRLGSYMRHFYQLGELINQAKYLEERIENLNKVMIQSWNEMKIEDVK